MNVSTQSYAGRKIKLGSTIICAIMKKGDRRYQSQKIAQHIKNKTHQKHHEENQRIRAVWTVQ